MKKTKGRKNRSTVPLNIGILREQEAFVYEEGKKSTRYSIGLFIDTSGILLELCNELLKVSL
jgi:hypothetical protein